MTEEEKRRLALSIMQQEQERLKNSTFRDYRSAEAAHAQRRINENQALFSSLAQNGISWKELDDAYNDGFKAGEREMLAYHFSFFYAAAAIAYHEQFSAEPEATAAFIKALFTAPGEARDHKELVEKGKRETGVDTSYADPPSAKPERSTRKDRQDIDRMMRTGITERDIEENRKAGYAAGWKTQFFLSSCYASVALVLHTMHSWKAPEIEAFLERISEIQDEEISAADIIERAKEEAGVDVSEIAQASI